ncbi:MAG: hypothetical protein AAB320_06130 [Elusimicrobiota bacterium]
MRQWSRAAVVLLVCLAAACGKKESAPARQPDTLKPPVSADRLIDFIKKKPGLSDERREELIQSARFLGEQERQEVTDRLELVLPPPSGWKPEKNKRKLKLTLIPEKTMLRKGEKFRYRMEIQNVGQENIIFSEPFAPFVKIGILDGTHDYTFLVTPPGGKEQEMRANFHTGAKLMGEEIFFPKHWTEAQIEAAVDKRRLEERAEGRLLLALQPGETLITRPDPPPPNRFRELFTRFNFDQLGTYRIRVVYDDRPEEQPEWFIQHLVRKGRFEAYQRDYKEQASKAIGPFESNAVVLEVVE